MIVGMLTRSDLDYELQELPHVSCNCVVVLDKR